MHVSRPGSRALYSSAKRGNLRFFFGGCAGLTAVRAMLETARTARQTGGDVVVGLVNSRGDSAIDALLLEFEYLPTLNSSIDAKHPTRIDVDAVRKRLPAILLVDTGLPASSETLRGALSIHDYHSWAAIEDVVALGVNVWAALDATGFSGWTSVGIGTPSRASGLSLL
jgi:two-component system sensor histidine kinase KdpD